MPKIPGIPPARQEELIYRFRGRAEDVRTGITRGLEDKFPNMPIQERDSLANEAVDKIIDGEGNGAVQQGLVLYGTQIAQRIYTDRQEEGVV